MQEPFTQDTNLSRFLRTEAVTPLRQNLRYAQTICNRTPAPIPKPAGSFLPVPSTPSTRPHVMMPSGRITGASGQMIYLRKKSKVLCRNRKTLVGFGNPGDSVRGSRRYLLQWIGVSPIGHWVRELLGTRLYSVDGFGRSLGPTPKARKWCDTVEGVYTSTLGWRYPATAGGGNGLLFRRHPAGGAAVDGRVEAVAAGRMVV